MSKSLLKPTKTPIPCLKEGCTKTIHFHGGVCEDGHCDRHHLTHNAALPEKRVCTKCGGEHGAPALDDNGQPKLRPDQTQITVSVFDALVVEGADGLLHARQLCRRCRAILKKESNGTAQILDIRCADYVIAKENERRRPAPEAESIKVIDLTITVTPDGLCAGNGHKFHNNPFANLGKVANLASTTQKAS